MKTIKKSTSVRPNITLLFVIAILVVASIVFAVIAFVPKSQGESSGGITAGSTISTITIETPYCELKYPKQWKDQMTVKESTVHGSLAETFYADIAGKQYALFTIYFGNSMVGELFGYLPGDGNDIPVYIECHKITDEIALSENELSLFCSMMEGVNEVAQSISSATGYSSP